MTDQLSRNRGRRFRPSVLCLPRGILAGVAAFAGPAYADTLTYENARFGTFVTFPAEVFREAMEPPPRGEGITFLSPDGASLAVFAMNNALEATPEEFAELSASGVGIDVETSHYRDGDDLITVSGWSDREIFIERSSGDGWVVVSGWTDEGLFYKRFVFGDDNIIHGLQIKYKFSERETYDALIDEIAASFGGP
ncbi:hypothetical protein [Pelagibacterium halotolerans]|uniref:hypothetical protein n=1 Tax=Pelagibacterium halotolerans TaxID=531813 RepID=UPI00384F3059